MLTFTIMGIETVMMAICVSHIDSLIVYEYFGGSGGEDPNIGGVGFQGGASFVDDLICYFCLVFDMLLCTSVYECLVVTFWERADLLALVFDV